MPSPFDLYIFWLIWIGACLFMCHDKLHSENDCKMTFMWLTPQFIDTKVSGAENRREFADYSMILYNEFYYDYNPTIPSKRDIPVLFVPGSGGTSRQVRSIASIMQNKTEFRHSSFRMKFFAVDFGKELSFLTGRTLMRQREYVLLAIKTIQNLYRAKKLEKKIILMGHSFGATVLYSLVSHKDFDSDISDLLIGIAGPLQDPPAYSDIWMVEFYRKMKREGTERLKDYGLLSFSGGIKDFLVPDKLTIGDNSTIHLPAWAIPNTPDYGADHQCVLWCNQMARHLSRVLYFYSEETVNAPKGMRRTGKELMETYFQKETEQRLKSAGVKYQNRRELEKTFEESKLWEEKEAKFELSKENPTLSFKIELQTQYQIFSVSVESTSLFNLLVYHDGMRFMTLKAKFDSSGSKTYKARTLVYGFNNNSTGHVSPFYVLIANGLNNKTNQLNVTIQDAYDMASLYNFILSNAAGILRNLYLTLIVLSLVDFEFEKDKKQSALPLFRQIHPFMAHIIWCGFLIPSFFAYNYEFGLNYLIQPLSIFALLVLAEPLFQYLIDARNYIGYYIKSSLKTANSLAIDCIVFLTAFFNSYLACALMSLKMILYASSPMRLMLAVMCTVPLLIMALSNTLLMTRSLQDYYLLTPLVVHVAQILTGYRILPFFVPKDDFDSHNIFSLAFKYVLVPFVIVYFVIFWPGLWFAYGGFVGISAMHTLPMSIVFVVGITVLSASFLSTHSDRSGAESIGLNLARIWGYTD